MITNNAPYLPIVYSAALWSCLLSGCVAMSSTNLVSQPTKPQLDLTNWQKGPEAARGMILLCGVLDPTTAAEVTAKILALDGSADLERITLVVNCPGGEVSAWRMIHNSMRMTSKPIDVVNAGNCYSAACAILASATGNRYAFPNAHFMIHRPLLAYGLTRGDYQQLLDFEVDAFERIIRRGSNLPEQWFPLTSRARYLDARQALEYGLIDRIITELPSSVRSDGHVR